MAKKQWEKQEVEDKYPKVYESCPVCRSKRRLFEELTAEARANHSALPDYSIAFNSLGGLVVDKRLQNKLPVGTVIPAFQVKTDICLGCGVVYATFINKSTAKVSIPTATKMPDKLDFSKLGMNNPAMS